MRGTVCKIMQKVVLKTGVHSNDLHYSKKLHKLISKKLIEILLELKKNP
jgi:hypothetical protein